MSSTSRVVIITGSGQGIGEAIALRLARDGYDVCVNDLPSNQAKIDQVVAEIQQLGRKAYGHAADVSSRAQVQGLVDAAVANLGPLTTMIANAGIAQLKPAVELTEEDLQRTFNVNIIGVHNCYAVAAKQMIKQESGGKLIAASSIAGFKAFPLAAHYSASKWAVRGLNQAFAMELGPHKITANAYAPGFVDTNLVREIDDAASNLLGRPKGTMLKTSADKAASGRFAVPEDIAKLVSFLASPDSDHVNGQTMLVDGGSVFN